MQAALDAFNGSMTRARDLHALHKSLSAQLTAAVDLSDVLRAEVVMSVSAFDFFVHELARLGMLEVHAGVRPQTESYKKFQLPLDSATAMATTGASPDKILDVAIRTKHGYLSFQMPDKVADAIRLFSKVKLWEAVAAECGQDLKSLKSALGLVIDRRNKIAHEADLDPSYPGQRWPIDRASVEYIFDLLDKVAAAIFKVAV